MRITGVRPSGVSARLTWSVPTLFLAIFSAVTEAETPEWMRMSRASLDVATAMASEVEPADTAKRDAELDRLHQELRELDAEHTLVTTAVYQSTAAGTATTPSDARDSPA